MYDEDFLLDMLQAAREVADFVANKERADLDADRMLRRAVERGIHIVGEAATRISPEFRSSHSEVPWEGIIGQRHVVAHDYRELILDRVWRVANEDIPELIKLIEPLVPLEDSL